MATKKPEKKQAGISYWSKDKVTCPVCKKEQQFKIYTGYRAVCETCGYEIHLK